MKYIITAILAILATASTKFFNENKVDIIEVGTDFDDALIEFDTAMEARSKKKLCYWLLNRLGGSCDTRSDNPNLGYFLKKAETLNAKNQAYTDKATKAVNAVFWSGW